MCNDVALSYVPQRDRAELLHAESVNTLRSLLFGGDGDGRLGLGVGDGDGTLLLGLGDGDGTLLLGDSVLLRELERKAQFYILVDGSRTRQQTTYFIQVVRQGKTIQR